VSVVAFKQAPKELKPNDVRDLPAGYVKSEYPEVWDLLRTYSYCTCGDWDELFTEFSFAIT
jgi:hypothetical protein